MTERAKHPVGPHIAFVVPGKPTPEGSYNAVKRGKYTNIVPQNQEELEAWRSSARILSRDAWKGRPRYLGAVEIVVSFVVERPRSHFGTGRNLGKIKDSAPKYPTTKPDTDKLQRALGDALGQTVLKDDAQIVLWHASKEYTQDYAEAPRTEVTVWFLEGEPQEAAADAS